MTGTILPPPPATAEPEQPHREPETKPPWWRRRWVLIVAALVLVLGGAVTYLVTRTSEHDQMVDDMEDAGFSESDAEQVVTDLEEGIEELDLSGATPTPNDGALSSAELEVLRLSYSAAADTEAGLWLEMPDESEFTDEQIRAYTDEACAIARDSDSLLELQVRLGQALSDEPHPEAAGFFGGAGMALACEDAGRAVGVFP